MDSINFKLLSHQGNIKIVNGDFFKVDEAALSEGTLFIEIPPTEIKGEENKLKIGVYAVINSLKKHQLILWDHGLINKNIL